MNGSTFESNQDDGNDSIVNDSDVYSWNTSNETETLSSNVPSLGISINSFAERNGNNWSTWGPNPSLSTTENSNHFGTFLSESANRIDWGLHRQSEGIESDDVDHRWITAAPPPAEPTLPMRSSLVRLNDEEFILCIERKLSDQPWTNIQRQLIKYNADRDEWSVFLDLPRPKEMNVRAFAIDQHEQRVYFCTNGPYSFQPLTGNITPSIQISGSKKEMVVIDLQTGSVVHETPKVASDGALACYMMLNVDGTIHRLYQSLVLEHSMFRAYNGHVTWDKNGKVYHTTKNGRNDINSVGTSVIYVPSKKIILMFAEDGIWRFHTVDDRWEKIKGIEATFYYVGAVLSGDQQHVIIIGGRLREARIPTASIAATLTQGREDFCPIHVLDISDDNCYALWKSSIIVPKRTSYVARSRNHRRWTTLTFGWLRRKLSSLPSVIHDVIAHFGSQDMIHCLAFQNQKGVRDSTMKRNWHHKIPMVDIMMSLEATDGGKSSLACCVASNNKALTDEK